MPALPINFSSLPALLLPNESSPNNISVEENLLKLLAKSRQLDDSTESNIVIAKLVKCSTRWTNNEYVGATKEATVKGYSVSFGSSAKMLNLPLLLFGNCSIQELFDSAQSNNVFKRLGFSVCGGFVPLKNCVKAVLPAVIFHESDLNSEEIFVPVENIYEVPLPFLLFQENTSENESKQIPHDVVPTTASEIKESRTSNTSDRVLKNVMNELGADSAEEELTSSGHYPGNTERLGPPPYLVVFSLSLNTAAHLQPYLLNEGLNDDQ